MKISVIVLQYNYVKSSDPWADCSQSFSFLQLLQRYANKKNIKTYKKKSE